MKAKLKQIKKEMHQEAHMCNSSAEVHDWIDKILEEVFKKTVIRKATGVKRLGL